MLSVLPDHWGSLERKNFFFALIMICLAYIIFEIIFIFYGTFSLDDFWLSYHNYQYKSALPYRDFSPYKTVLGYYLYLPPLIFFQGPISHLIYTKLWITLINSFFLVYTASWLKKFFVPKAVLTALALIVFMQIFLFFSIDIRVDFLAYWFCLISVLFILEEKYALAGISLGLGFIICQKAIWYFIATNCGLVCLWFVERGNRTMLREIFIYNLCALLILGAYILFWASLSNMQTVLRSVFYEPYLISSVNWFRDYNYYLWRIVTDNNPGLILLWPIVFLGLFILPVKKRSFIIPYSLVILIFMLRCKQPFAYYFLATTPVLFLSYCAFFSEIYKGYIPSDQDKKIIVFFSLLYLLFLMFLSLKYTLPNIYLVAALIPTILIISFCTDLDRKKQRFFNKLIVTSLILIGVIFPVLRLYFLLPVLDGRYQKSMVYLVNDLLTTGGTYIAGCPLLLDIKQPVPGLVHLVGPSIAYLEHPTKELASIMQLSSLYFSQNTVPQLIESIKKEPVKIYVDNNRFHRLAAPIHEYLESQYQHFWGSIFLYAPSVKAGQHRVHLKFAGDYKVEAAQDAFVTLDGQKVGANTVISLVQKQYDSYANKDFRLKLIPKLKSPLDPQFQENQWQNVLNWS